MAQINQRLRESMNTGRPPFGGPPFGGSRFGPPAQAAAPPPEVKAPPKPEDTLKELSQAVPLQQLLQISRQIKGKFEPVVGMQLFVKRADGEWYLAEVTEVPVAQKAKVRFAYDLDAADGTVGRDKVRIPNGEWPRFPEIPAETTASPMPQ